MKYFLALLLFCLGIYFFNYRYLLPEAGVASRSPDYSTHISIEQHIKTGLLFPELHKSEKGRHAVSKYLPVYHGLLGFHFSSYFLESFGMPLPGAYSLLMDLSLLICLIVLTTFIFREWKKSRRWEPVIAFITLLTIFLSQFSRSVDEGFFSQVMSYALLMLAFETWRSGKKILSVVLFCFATVTYPDFLVWFLPVIALNAGIRINLSLRLLFMLFWGLLVYILFVRKDLPGLPAVSLYPLVFLVLLLCLYGKSLYQERRTFFLCLSVFTIVTTGFLLASQKNFTWGYYALKLTYPAVFFLIYAFTTMPLLQSAKGRLLVILYAFFFLGYSEVSVAPISRFLGRPQVLNNGFYSSLVNTNENLASKDVECTREQTIVLPFASDLPNGKVEMLGLWARNSLLLNSDISSGQFKNPSLGAIFDDFFSFERTYWEGGAQEGNKRFIDLLRLVPPVQDICIVSPTSERSLFNDNSCFVIMKQQGGQIYVRCKAQAKL